MKTQFIRILYRRGQDGRPPQLRATDTHVEWRSDDKDTWKQLFARPITLGADDKLKLDDMPKIKRLAISVMDGEVIANPLGVASAGYRLYNSSGAPVGNVEITISAESLSFSILALETDTGIPSFTGTLILEDLT